MLSMAYLGRLLTNWVPQKRIRSFRVWFATITPPHAEPVCVRGLVRAGCPSNVACGRSRELGQLTS